MADLRGNPWSFLPADQAVTTAITSVVRNGLASALVTTGVAHGLAAGNMISLQGTNPLGWTGPYQVQAVPSGTTFLIAIDSTKSQLANGGAAGNVVTLIYNQLIEVTQMIWNNPTATQTILLTDANGRTVWNENAPTAGGPLTYMKAFPIYGLCINTLGSGVLQISV